MLDYNIPVAQPLMGLNTAIGNEIDRNNEQARVAGLQQQRERLISEAQAAYRSGDLNALAEFSIANPELGAMATEQAQHKNERTKAVREQTMAEIVGGADPYEAVINGSQKIRREGGDPSDMLQLLDKSPQEIRQLTEVAMATQFPDSFKNV